MLYRYVFITVGVLLALTSILYLCDSNTTAPPPLYVTPSRPGMRPGGRPVLSRSNVLTVNATDCYLSSHPGSQVSTLKCSDTSLTCHQKIFTSSTCPPKLIKEHPRECPEEKEFHLLMRKRGDWVKKQCQKYTSHEAMAKEMFYYQNVGRSGFLWCPVYKAGSSSTNAHLCPLYYNDSTCHDRSKNTAIMWRVREEFKPFYASSGTPSLLIVRHPFERLLSAFRDKIQTPDPTEPYIGPIFDNAIGPHRPIPARLIPHKKLLLEQAVAEVKDFLSMKQQQKGQYLYLNSSHNPYVKPMSATFEEFVRGVLMGWTNEHWSPVSTYCAPCARRYTYILHVEEFDCEFERFLEVIGAPDSVHGERSAYVENNKNPARSGKNNSDFYEYFATLPENLLSALFDWYKYDCELFGYDCEKTLCEIAEWKKAALV
eukprot:sb/3464944/